MGISLSRLALLIALVLLTACASYSPPRTGSRTAPVPASTVPTTATHDDATITPGVPLPRQEAPPDAVAPIDASRDETPAPVTPTNPRSAATLLLEEVDSAVAQGDLERAAALCERALRIAPRDAFLWYRLAAVRALQGRTDEANGFARRALSFATADPALTRQINELLGSL